jgi:uncharacterized protein
MPLDPCVSQKSLEIRTTSSKGRGVFATKRFAEGELIESAPVIIVPANDWPYVEKTVFYHYLFAWGDFNGDITALILGYGSIYNHSYNPSACYIKDYSNQLIKFFALKSILPEEEITINYNGDPKNQDPIWFEVI